MAERRIPCSTSDRCGERIDIHRSGHIHHGIPLDRRRDSADLRDAILVRDSRDIKVTNSYLAHEKGHHRDVTHRSGDITRSVRAGRTGAARWALARGIPNSAFRGTLALINRKVS